MGENDPPIRTRFVRTAVLVMRTPRNLGL